MGKTVDLIGERYGRLTVIAKSGQEKEKHRRSLWLCECDCGKQKIVTTDHLKSGSTKSCGCLKREVATAQILEYSAQNPGARRTHGATGKKIYWAYQHMMERCYSPQSERFISYGARGICVCDEWKNNPKAFVDWSLSNGFEEDLTLDRINVNGDYCPENCRWVSWDVQANNKRSSVYVNVRGEKLTLAQVAQKYGLRKGTVWWRHHHGWEDEDLIKPLRGNYSENQSET